MAAKDGGDTLKAEFNMGQLDYFRYNMILEMKAEILFRVNNGEKGAIKELYSILKTFYFEMRGVLVPALRTKFDNLLEACIIKKKGKTYYNIIKLEELNNELMIQRQAMGAGVPVWMKKSDSAKMSAGFKRR